MTSSSSSLSSSTSLLSPSISSSSAVSPSSSPPSVSSSSSVSASSTSASSTSSSSISENSYTITYLEFSVSDCGKGISATDQALLFQKFTQVDVTRKWAGTGLGLAICKQLVEAMGGQINVKSAVGQGSSFYFSIPVKVPNADHVPTISFIKPLAIDARFEGERILVVDDNVPNQKVLKRMLQKLGCSVDVAKDGQEAIEFSKRESFSVIFMDQYMPICDGFTAAQLIRDHCTKTQTPCPKIVAITGTYESRMESMMDDILIKPVRFDALPPVLMKFCSNTPKPLHLSH